MYMYCKTGLQDYMRMPASLAHVQQHTYSTAELHHSSKTAQLQYQWCGRVAEQPVLCCCLLCCSRSANAAVLASWCTVPLLVLCCRLLLYTCTCDAVPMLLER